MNDSEKRRLDVIVKNLKSKNPGYTHVFGGHIYNVKELIKLLKSNDMVRQMYFDMLDGYEIARLTRDATRGK